MAAINNQLQQAIALARAGKENEARARTEEVLTSDPDNIHALFLMSTLAQAPEEQADYLQRILAIDPTHEPAQERLNQLQVQDAETPEATTELEEEELPDTMVMEAPLFEESQDEVESEEQIPATEEQAESEEEHHALFARTTSADEAEAAEINFDDMRSDDSPVTEGVQEEGQGQAESASLLEQAEAGSVPDWLRDAGGYAEHSAVADEEQAPETVTQSEDADEVPDWLKDEPDDDWLDQTLLDDSDTWSEPDYEEPADRAPEEMPTEGTGQEQPSEAYVPPGTEGLDLEAELATASAAGEPAPTPPEQRHSRSSTRTYEIILGVLIILAIAVVAALAYVILVPPF